MIQTESLQKITWIENYGYCEVLTQDNAQTEVTDLFLIRHGRTGRPSRLLEFWISQWLMQFT